MEYFAPGIDVAGAVNGVTEADMEAMLADVWATLELPDQPAGLDPATSDTISSWADLHGDAENRGARLNLTVTVDRGALGLLVGAFFGTTGVADGAEVDDAVGELANMCAGAIKTLLEGEWVIGIPYRDGNPGGPGDQWIEATVPVEAGWLRLALRQAPGSDDDPVGN